MLPPLLSPAVADPGGPEGAMPPRPVKNSHKKDGCQRRPHRFHVSHPPLTRPLDPLLPWYGRRRLWPFITGGLIISRISNAFPFHFFSSKSRLNINGKPKKKLNLMIICEHFNLCNEDTSDSNFAYPHIEFLLLCHR